MAAPFDPVDRDGRLYGRGAQDMKGGVAAMIDAVRADRRRRRPGSRPRHRGGVVDEEHSSLGADALVTRWRADAAVVTEPTDLDVAVAHKGFEWVEIETRGRAAHGSRPRRRRRRDSAHGPRAARLEALDRPLQAGAAPSAAGDGVAPRLDSSSGGRELSSYPDRARCRWSGARCPAKPEGSLAGEVDAHPGAAGGRTIRSSRPSADRSSSRPPYEIAARAPAAGPVDRRRSRRRLSRRHDRHDLLDRRRDSRRRRHPVGALRPGGAGLHSVEE